MFGLMIKLGAALAAVSYVAKADNTITTADNSTHTADGA